MLPECRSFSSRLGARNKVRVPLGRTLFKSRSNKLIVGALSHSAVLVKKLVTDVERTPLQAEAAPPTGRPA